jgi:3-hydroxybutyryl-CoA dehydrogenase
MPEIKTLAVIGAGALGRDIACATALAGYRTILEDILPASLRRAGREIRNILDQSIQSGRISPQQAEAALVRLEYAGSVEEAARQADLVIEAVPDEMESKLEIITLLDKIAKPHTILATTTQTLSVAEIASVTYRAKTILGLRFLPAAGEPEARLDSIEIVRTADTDDETIVTCAEVGRRIGKRMTIIAEFPGD